MTVPYEYFCHSCGQLRMCYNPLSRSCGNCQGTNLTKGFPGSLNRDTLKEQFKQENK